MCVYWKRKWPDRSLLYTSSSCGGGGVSVGRTREQHRCAARAGCQWPECFDLSVLLCTHTHSPHTRYSRRRRRLRLRPCTSTLGATCPLRARVASQPVPPYTHTHTHTHIHTTVARERDGLAERWWLHGGDRTRNRLTAAAAAVYGSSLQLCRVI